jgi:hypothetical protein
MVVLITGLFVCIPASMLLMNQKDLWLQAFGATITGWWMLLFVLYVVIFDMKKRWPHLPLKVRWGMLIPDGRAHREHDEYATAYRKLQESLDEE